MMKRKQILLLAAAAIVLNSPPIWAQTSKSESDTRLPQGEPSQAGKGPGTKDSYIGESQSKRADGHQDIRQAQEALKNQGHDPGPIDGVMGPQTRQALRAFQSSNGLKQTGMLDAETKQRLNIDDPSSKSSRPARGESSAPMGK
jgi:peptidoglycan hydrolase-like protein with peptidoglycan-binding domain